MAIAKVDRRGFIRALGSGPAAYALLQSTVARGQMDDSATTPFQLSHNGVDVRVEVNGGSMQSSVLTTWIRRSIDIVGGYYGSFPTHRLRIRVTVIDGTGVHGGTTYGTGGGFIRIRVGGASSDSELSDDWVLVHEMVHLALPDVGEQHAWLSEGLAVYVEGIARAQAGNRTEQDVWAEQMRSMPRGLPQAGDQGLDRTHTWARTYWGGALFCLLADVEIHRRTANRLGLQDAMRTVTRLSGGLTADWPIERVLAAGDEATGTRVLRDLYSKMKDAPFIPDLADLWRQLGIESDGSSVRLLGNAPLAQTRESIMHARPAALRR